VRISAEIDRLEVIGHLANGEAEIDVATKQRRRPKS